jgi:ABC-2 type transport system ATP-binding protein
LFGGGSPRELLEARQRIGGTLENPNFYPYLTGWDNLRIVANIKGKRDNDIAEAIDVVGLGKRKKDPFKTYSLGMKQRLALAAAMLGDPELVILDEPANGLDPEGMREIREIIKRLADLGKTIFLSSHLLWEVERTCSHVAIIKEGRIVGQGSVGEITSGNVMAGLVSDDLEQLRRIVVDYPQIIKASIRNNAVEVELRDADLAALNRFVAERGVYVSHLALRQRSLEDVFMELTGSGGHGMGEIA